MVYYDVQIDIEVEDFLEECDEKDIQKIIEYLKDEGYLNERYYIPPPNKNFLDEEWENVINTLNESRHKLTIEEEETIKKIVKKY